MSKRDAEIIERLQREGRVTYADGTCKQSLQVANHSTLSNSSIRKVRAVPPRDNGMNKTEAAYAKHLDAVQKTGEITGWWFQSIKLRLADKTFYTPDFLCQTCIGELEFHEVKGFLRDDASVKFKVAKSLYPMFRWQMAKKVKGGWDIREMPW